MIEMQFVENFLLHLSKGPLYIVAIYILTSTWR